MIYYWPVLFHSPEEELSYLCDLGFLLPQTVEDVLSFRQISEESEAAIREQLANNDSQIDSSSSDLVDWEEEWGEDAPKKGAAEGAEQFHALISSKMESNEKLLDVFRSSVRDTIRRSMSAIDELITRWELQQQGNKARDNRVESTGDEPMGLLAKVAEGYLAKRLGSQESAALLETLEYIESPLQQMKRAGLGLLSQGLGRLG